MNQEVPKSDGGNRAGGCGIFLPYAAVYFVVSPVLFVIMLAITGGGRAPGVLIGVPLVWILNTLFMHPITLKSRRKEDSAWLFAAMHGFFATLAPIVGGLIVVFGYITLLTGVARF